MNLNRRLLLALTVAAVLLLAMSAATWRSLAASPPDDPASAPRQGERPQGSAGVLAAPVPGGPGFVTQSAHLFTPANKYTEWNYCNRNELYNDSDTTPAAFAAPLSLPHGATVTKLVAYYYDYADVGLTVTLERAHLDSSSYDTMASVTSTGQGYNHGEDASIDYAQIDLQSYTYYAYLTIPVPVGGEQTDLTLVGIRVDYEYPGYVPLAMNDR